MRISPFLRLLSIQNRFWFEIQRALKWSRPHYQETAAGTLQDPTSTQSERIRQLGNVEKSRQRRSRHFAVLTYYEYAPRVKMTAALPGEGRVLARLGWAGQTRDFFEHSLQLTMIGSSGAFIWILG